MIILVASFRIKPAMRNRMLELSRAMIDPSNNEEGCISYQFFQNPFNPDSFMFFERWKNREALDYHFETEYFKNFTSAIPGLLAEKESVITYEVSNESTIGRTE